MVIPIKELSSVENFTLVVGSARRQDSSWNSFDGIIEFQEFPGLPYILLGALAGKFVLAHIGSLRPFYCSKMNRLQAVNIFAVLLQALDIHTWALLGLGLFVVYIYILMTTKQTRSDSLFEMVEMLLQRVTRKREVCRISILVGCFFIEFLYLSGTTESIIVPREQRPPANMLELIQTGHKFFAGCLSRAMGPDFPSASRSHFGQVLIADLQREGFRGNLTDIGRLWGEHIIKEDFANPLEFERTCFNLATLHDTISLTVATSATNNRPAFENAARYAKHLEGTDRGCNFVNKLYAKSASFYYFLAWQGKLATEKLDLILGETDISGYWGALNEHFRRTETSVFESQQIASMKLDDVRTIAIFGLLLAGVLVSVAVALVELSQSEGWKYFWQDLGNIVSSFLHKSKNIFNRVLRHLNSARNTLLTFLKLRRIR